MLKFVSLKFFIPLIEKKNLFGSPDINRAILIFFKKIIIYHIRQAITLQNIFLTK